MVTLVLEEHCLAGKRLMVVGVIRSKVYPFPGVGIIQLICYVASILRATKLLKISITLNYIPVCIHVMELHYLEIFRALFETYSYYINFSA